MNIQEFKKINLPDTPGVYFFYGPKKEILYIGKATSLKDRVKSYFSKDLITTRGLRLVQMVEMAKNIKFIETQSVLEALMLESSLIKKHVPHFNTLEKDNKSFNSVIITDEDFPRVLVIRSRNIEHFKLTTNSYKLKAIYGPFPHGGELREALKIIRKIFPYRDKCIPNTKLCFNAQIGLCSGVCGGKMDKKDYKKQIKHLEMFFSGEKDNLVKELEKEMKTLAKNELFEEAEKTKRTLYALEHIQDVALIKRDVETDNTNAFRIEAYDIAHLSGQNTVGVMTVVEDGEVRKDQYRKFKIKASGAKVTIDDIKNLKEVLVRRLGHAEWKLPNLIVVDGSVAQINATKEVLKERGFNIDLVSVVKDERHKAREIMGEKKFIEKWGKSIILANSEAHRFAIGYHRRLRGKGFRI